MSYQISIGLSALRAAQVGIDVVGQNVANANTPGYHRQIAELASRTPIAIGGYERGTGVEVSHISRIRSEVLESSLLEYSGEMASVDAQLETARQLESLIGFGAGSLSDQVGVLYQRLEELSARPHDETSRRLVIEAAEELSKNFSRLSGDLDRVRSASVEKANGILDHANSIAQDILRLNGEIDIALAAGRQPNDLSDRRDSLIRDLGEMLDASVHSNDGSVLIGDGSVLIGAGRTPSLKLSDSQDALQLLRATDDHDVDVSRGVLGGVFENVNVTIPNLQDSLDSLAAGIMETLDSIHVRGVGLDGAFTVLTGQRFVANATQPIAEVLPNSGVQQGTFPITIVNDETGERVLHSIPVDPQIDSLEDIASRLSEVSEIVALVDPATGNLSIRSVPGSSFDFTGVDDDSATPQQTDETNLLRVLGMNSFFIGDDARSMAVNPELLASPRNLAASLTGQPGDSDNLTVMIESRSQPQSSLNERTLEQTVGDIVAQVGSNVVSLERSWTSLDAVHANIESQIASVSGVNPDEEVLQMLQYQRAFEAAARYLSTINETTLELMQII